MQRFGETKNQQRRQENFYFKTVYEPSHHTEVDFSWLYTPYRSTYFKKDYRNSDFTLHGGGFLISAGYHTLLPFASLDIKAAYKESENNREAPTHNINTQYEDGSWDREGFLGDLEKAQKSIQTTMGLALQEMATGLTTHQINLGFEAQHIRGVFDRPETSYIYTYRFNRDPSRIAYAQNEAEAKMRMYSGYLEDIVHFYRLELRPGVRFEYDSFLENRNLAPRLAGALDIFGNRNTILIAGANRYYARTLLTYKLREALIPFYREVWSAEDGWQRVYSNTRATKYSSLKSPYTDEYVLGLEQALLGGRMIFKYVQREGRDQLASELSDVQEDGLAYYTLNNNGRSHHKSYRLSWERQWRNHYLKINGTYQETESSNETYDDPLEEEEPPVSFEGKLTSKSELPRKDFNRPWVINLTYVGKLPYGFTLSGLAKYRSGYKAILKTSNRDPDIELPDDTHPYIYEEVKRGGAVTLSCRVEWEKRLYSNHSMILSLDIYNLLNKKTSVGNTDDYEIGRQVWAGMEYQF
ncbi:MAG: hypothetical protein BA870_08820 [Desulfuromonadales bacterium C00003094]|nr:MAG: hypothetical protein BA870_08820 [Desulfuromonadales bacterium C00003094]